MSTRYSFRCVVDASVGIKMFVQETLSAEASRVFLQLALYNTQLHVPDLFYIECTNVFWKYVRRGALDIQRVQNDVNDLCRLTLLATPTFVLAADALGLAATYDVTAYDATYAALALRIRAPFVTADSALVRRLAPSPVQAVWLGDVDSIL